MQLIINFARYMKCLTDIIIIIQFKRLAVFTRKKIHLLFSFLFVETLCSLSHRGCVTTSNLEDFLISLKQ